MRSRCHANTPGSWHQELTGKSAGFCRPSRLRCTEGPSWKSICVGASGATGARSDELMLTVRASFICRSRQSTITLMLRWYTLIPMRFESRSIIRCLQSSDSLWESWSVVPVAGVPLRDIQKVTKILAMEVTVISWMGVVSGHLVNHKVMVRTYLYHWSTGSKPTTLRRICLMRLCGTKNTCGGEPYSTGTWCRLIAGSWTLSRPGIYQEFESNEVA